MKTVDSLAESKLDVTERGGSHVCEAATPGTGMGAEIRVDPAVIEAFPVLGTKLVSACQYGKSNWATTAKIEVELPTGCHATYFLKYLSLGDHGRVMVEGEFESMRALHAVSTEFVAYPYAWGKHHEPSPTGLDTYFFLSQFRNVSEQPLDPIKFTAYLAHMHKNSVSPTGKFGFHITTSPTFAQLTDCWEESWATLYAMQLGRFIELDAAKNPYWPEFEILGRLTLEKVIPRLLQPLQEGGSPIKPCLVHGDLWDENVATDDDTKEPFIFDAGSFYAHNEYEIGNWRAPRHRLSGEDFVQSYKDLFPPSEPANEWDDRNLLYSFRYDLSPAILIPGFDHREVVKKGMEKLCKKYCPEDLKAALGQQSTGSRVNGHSDGTDSEEEKA